MLALCQTPFWALYKNTSPHWILVTAQDCDSHISEEHAEAQRNHRAMSGGSNRSLLLHGCGKAIESKSQLACFQKEGNCSTDVTWLMGRLHEMPTVFMGTWGQTGPGVGQPGTEKLGAVFPQEPSLLPCSPLSPFPGFCYYCLILKQAISIFSFSSLSTFFTRFWLWNEWDFIYIYIWKNAIHCKALYI